MNKHIKKRYIKLLKQHLKIGVRVELFPVLVDLYKASTKHNRCLYVDIQDWTGISNTNWDFIQGVTLNGKSGYWQKLKDHLKIWILEQIL